MDGKIYVSHDIVFLSVVMSFVEVTLPGYETLCYDAHKMPRLILTFKRKERNFNVLVVSYDT